MKVTLNANEFLAALEFTAISERGVDSVTAYVDQLYVNVNTNTCQLMRYGRNVVKKSHILDCEADESKHCQVNYQALKAIMSKIARRFETVDLMFEQEADNHSVRLKAGRLETVLNITEFSAPDEPVLNEQSEICVNKQHLDQILKRARVASAKNDVRHQLNGVLLTTDSTSAIRAVGTDGHRMALSKCQYLAHNYLDHQLILSNDGVKYLESIIKLAPDDNLVLHFNDSFLAVQLDNGASLKMQVIDARYPDWKRVIPLNTQTEVLCDREELLNSIQAALPLTNPKFKGAKLEFTASGIEITTTSQVGDYSDLVEVSGFSGPNMSLGLNLDYLIAALVPLECQNVKFGINDGSSGVLLTENEEANGLQILMPIRL